MRTLCLIKRVIPLILVGFLSASCATIFSSCSAADFVKVFGFDLDRARLYHGKKENPDDTVGFNDSRLEKFIAMSETDWSAVRSRLATCH